MRVIIESPYSSGEHVPSWETSYLNIEYAKRCLLDSLKRGESPFASHLLYTQVLDDRDSDQRKMGMTLALAWYEVSDLCAVYTDRGISEGMESGIKHAESLSITVEKRSLENDETIQTSLSNSIKPYWR
tara:strand:+ start:5675 stop:6061 length:387 start_codon:yes stop_codon:yes gene_type:complete